MKFTFDRMKSDFKSTHYIRKGTEDMGTYAGEEEIRFVSKDYMANLENPIDYIVEVIIIKI